MTTVPPAGPRRYAVCGLSNRGVASFVLPLLGIAPAGRGVPGTSSLGFGDDGEDLSDHGTVVAVVDPDEARVAAFNADIVPTEHERISCYPPDAFDRMVTETRPDAVIVTSPDHTHGGYILRALDLDLDVVTEKPMVATAAEAGRVLAAEKSSRGTVQVTHNLRFTPRHMRVKEMVAEGMIGRPLQVLLDYHVDRVHGASYFLRWNRTRSASGGLSVHKSTHHIDLVSWWLGQEPVSAYALGGRSYYGAESPHRPRGAEGRPVPNDQVREADPYYQAQSEAGTFPGPATTDRVGMFGLPYAHQYPAGRDDYLYDDEIDIEDHFTALLDFDRGAHLAYMINFSSAWEGYRITLTGTEGEIEIAQGRRPDGEDLGMPSAISFRPLFGEPRSIEVETGAGGHGGADPLMRSDLFRGPSERSRRLGLAADSREGAVAVAAGEAIWRSIALGAPVSVRDLL